MITRIPRLRVSAPAATRVLIRRHLDRRGQPGLADAAHPVPVQRVSGRAVYASVTSSIRPSPGAAYCAPARPVPALAADSERPGGNQRDTPGLAWRPEGQAAGPSPGPASGQRDDEAREASAGNDAAVAAYRLSVQAGNPLSERRLAQMFGHTSRRWARARIADARQASPLPDSPGTPVTAYP